MYMENMFNTYNMQELEAEGGRGYIYITVTKMHVQKIVRFREAHSLYIPTLLPSTYTGMSNSLRDQ